MRSKIILGLLLVCLPLTTWAQEEKFEPYGKVFGEVFGDYYYKLSGAVDSLLDGPGQYQKTPTDHNAFELRRFYLGYEYFFSEKFSGRLMFEGSDGELNAGGKRSVNVKYAYLRWNNIFPGSKLIVGGQSTPTFSTYTDKVWGYRSIEKNVLDFRKLGGSNDFGVSLSGNLVSNLSYYVMVGNGRKQKPENDKYKKVYASVIGEFLDEKLLVHLYFDYEPDSDSTNTNTVKGLVAYQIDQLTIGVEPFLQNTSDGSKPLGMQLFVRGQLVPDVLNAFGRVDIFNPDSEIDASGYNESFMTFGLDFTPHSKVHIMPNIWVNSYSKKSSADIDKDADVVGRLTFRYKF